MYTYTHYAGQDVEYMQPLADTPHPEITAIIISVATDKLCLVVEIHTNAALQFLIFCVFFHSASFQWDVSIFFL